MCEHSNIAVSHYATYIQGEVGFRRGCHVYCADCDKILFDGKTDIQSAYDYIGNNKAHFHTLVDLTCDNLNEIYSIPYGIEPYKGD